MAPKSFSLWFSVLILAALTACTPKSQPSPTSDQKSIATYVAATLNAATTATQRAVPTPLPTATTTPTFEPTLPPSSPTPTILPTSSIPIDLSGMVAYTRYSDVYLWTNATGPVRLTDMHDVTNVRLSDDGKLIAFKRQDPEDFTLQELWVVNTSGIPDPQQLVGAEELAALVPPDAGSSVLGYGVLDFQWRPTTHVLAYNTLILHEGVGFGPNHDLHLVNADTLLKTTLFDTGQGGLFYYSPDGSQIALSNPESISLVNADGSNYRPDVLTFPGVITYAEYAYHPQPRWSNDSASLGVVIPPHDPLGTADLLTNVWRIPLDGSQATLLISIPAIPFAWPDTALSPDLQLAGYSTDLPGPDPNQRALHIAALNGMNDRFYDSGESLEFKRWSPDSQHFIYAVQGGDKEGLYIGGLLDSPVKILADPHAVDDLRWLDASRFVYMVNMNNLWELHLGNLDAHDLVLIDTIPDASPDFDLLP